MRTGEEQVVCFGLKDGTDLSSKLKRAQAAQAFGIKTIHFVPFEAGVLECAATCLTNYHDYTH